MVPGGGVCQYIEAVSSRRFKGSRISDMVHPIFRRPRKSGKPAAMCIGNARESVKRRR